MSSFFLAVWQVLPVSLVEEFQDNCRKARHLQTVSDMSVLVFTVSVLITFLKGGLMTMTFLSVNGNGKINVSYEMLSTLVQ